MIDIQKEFLVWFWRIAIVADVSNGLTRSLKEHVGIATI
jgi:hypothetical protein